jgi:hypothetical protein
VNTARLFLVRRAKGLLCIALLDRDREGTTCASASSLPTLFLMSGRLLSGVAANNVARIVVVGTQGARHTVPLTRDRGFIWDCRAWSGCSTVIAEIQAYDRAGKTLYRTRW